MLNMPTKQSCSHEETLRVTRRSTTNTLLELGAAYRVFGNQTKPYQK